MDLIIEINRLVCGRVLVRDTLAQFEVAQLANLCCEDAEEAKALVPR